MRQIDFNNSGARPALFTARDAVLEQAREETADVSLGKPILSGTLLSVDVRVTNKTGHKFPSGVGFRRAFIELLVKDAAGTTVLWGSGRTTDLGVIVDGNMNPLPSEFFDLCPCTDCPETANGYCYQPHYEIITEEYQVQIYEALEQNNGTTGSPNDPMFTYSFLNRFFEIKDNRLLPKGSSPFGPYYQETKPGPRAILDPEYLSPNGDDSVRYEIDLTPSQAAQAATVEVTLYFQTTPPAYLDGLFKHNPATTGDPPKPDESTDIARLYYMASKLNVEATEDIKDWKLKIASETQRTINIAGACCLPNHTCEEIDEQECLDRGGVPHGPGSVCLGVVPCCLPDGTCEEIDSLCCDNPVPECLGDADGNGKDEACEQNIPTVSVWGLVVLTLLLLTGVKIYFGRRVGVAS